MMKGRWKWVLLSIGLVLISATCGFGYEAKVTRTQFEEAKDAFAKKDWDRVIQNLSDKNDPHTPPKKALRAFVHRYVEPVLAQSKFNLATRQWPSSMVPVGNEDMSYQETFDGRHLPFIRLEYSDEVMWFDSPIDGKMYGIFQGKQVTISFFLTFFRVAYEQYPPRDRSDRWRSVADFVRHEKRNLKKMGITPAHLYSKTKTWDEYEKFYEDRVRLERRP